MNNYVSCLADDQMAKRLSKKLPRFSLSAYLGIYTVDTRNRFNEMRERLILKHGMNMPQNLNDALTRKDLELKQRGE